MGSIEKGWLSVTQGFADRLVRSWTIIVHSLSLLRAHKVLLLFPLINVVAFVGIAYFFAVPAVFNATIGDAWWALWHPGAAVDAVLANAREKDFNPFNPSFSYATLGAIYLFWVFAATFVNAAFYAEILSALNGRGVSMARGFAAAGSKVLAILGWSLAVGTIGLAVRAIRNRFGAVWGLIAGLGGVVWSMAGIFVVPIIIKEKRQLSPLAYVKISANLIKKTWGEHVIAGGVGIVGAIGVAVLLILFIAFGPIIVSVAGPGFGGLTLLLVTTLLLAAQLYAISIIGNVFNCGLYIYATEGVVPAPFDADLFAKSWVVLPTRKSGQGTEND